MEIMMKVPITHPDINVGDIVGSWRVIDNTIIRKYNSRYITCQCECGTTKELLVQHFTSTTHYNSCKKCSQHKEKRNLVVTHPTIKIGDVFENWTVIDNTIVREYEVYSNGNRSKYRQPKIKVQCSCGNMELRKPTSLTTKSKKLNSYTACKKCFSPPKGDAHYKWGGSGKIPGTVLYTVKQNAKHRSKNGREIEVAVTTEYLAKLYTEQDGKCALTGIPIEASITNTRNRGRVWTASVDRIDSSKGYVEGNVQWLHKDINRMKWDLDTDKFIELCKLVASKNE
jgi:hypothetical protein